MSLHFVTLIQVRVLKVKSISTRTVMQEPICHPRFAIECCDMVNCTIVSIQAVYFCAQGEEVLRHFLAASLHGAKQWGLAEDICNIDRVASLK